MDTKVGNPKEGMQAYITDMYWRAGHAMRAVYDAETETVDGIDSKEALGNLVFVPSECKWLPDEVLVDTFNERGGDTFKRQGWVGIASLAAALGREPEDG